MRAIWLVLVACGRIGFDGSGGDRTSSSYQGAVLFVEHFDDPQFDARGWYDNTSGTISTTEHAPGSTASLECDYTPGDTDPTGGAPHRHLFAPTDALYLSYWVKRGNARGGMSVAFPISSADDPLVGPSSSHLTATLDIDDAGTVTMTSTDALAINQACVEQDDGTVVGCNGDFATYPFGEVRALMGCNGAPADVSHWDCSPLGGGAYNNAAYRQSASAPFADSGWHFIEAFLAMNSIVGGVGQHDGSLRYWIDGVPALAFDEVQLRTGAEPTLAWGQLFFSAYISAGAPAAQTLWIDELTVATGVR